MLNLEALICLQTKIIQSQERRKSLRILGVFEMESRGTIGGVTMERENKEKEKKAYNGAWDKTQVGKNEVSAGKIEPVKKVRVGGIEVAVWENKSEKGDSFYIMQSGAVQVLLESAGGRSEIVAVLGPQDCFGEMALLSGEPRSATIRTVKDTIVWRLSREDWDELIEKHPTWLLHFCATLSKRVIHWEKQYSQGRDAFNTLAEEFYSSRPPEEQAFLRHLSLLTTINPKTVNALLQSEKGGEFINNLVKSQLPFIRILDGEGYELHGFFKDF